MNSNESDRDSDSKSDSLERYLDGLMSEEEANAYLANSDAAEEIGREKKTQSEIDDTLRRAFKITAIDEEVILKQVFGHVQKTEASDSVVDVDSNNLSSRLHAFKQSPIAKLAIAAALLIAVGLVFWLNYGSGGRVSPYFTPRSLAKLYVETTELGFRPYYNCEDDERFSSTFEERQGQRLALSKMPTGTRMLGLSYLGGISRETTAMLGEVDERPVIVFVDLAKNRDSVIGEANDIGLNVYVEEKNGLIFCEVTPLDSARMIQYFELEK